MSQEEYTVGRNVQQYFRDFHLQYNSMKESAALLPQPMQSIVNFINETVLSLESGHNLGKDASKDMLQHCRPTVERYVFGKLYERVFGMYKCKHAETDSTYNRTVESI